MYSHQTCSITPLQVIIARMLGRHRDEGACWKMPVNQWARRAHLWLWENCFEGYIALKNLLVKPLRNSKGFNRCLCVRTGKRHRKPWECGPSESSVWEDVRRTRRIYWVQQMILISLLLWRHGTIWRCRFFSEAGLGREWNDVLPCPYCATGSLFIDSIPEAQRAAADFQGLLSEPFAVY